MDFNAYLLVILYTCTLALFSCVSCENSATEGYTTVQTKLKVHRFMRSRHPFNVTRNVMVPDGYLLQVVSWLNEARFLLALPNGDVLVSQPWEGNVILLRRHSTSYSLMQYIVFASKLTQPHDMVLHTENDTHEYVYIAESNKIARYRYRAGDVQAGTSEIIVDNLPDESLPELKGEYHHSLKNIAIKDGLLYVSIASATNDDPKDLEAEPKRGAIYAYPLDGGDKGDLFADGIRNAEGLAFAPDTDDLWVVVNQRDNVKYPYNDTSGNYGKRLSDYVDKNPPEEFTRIIENATYGWPFCNPVPNPTMDDLDYVPDFDRNPEENVTDCSKMRRIDKGIDAHTAPLGLTFWSGANVPQPFRDAAVVALHGSWNRVAANGRKVIFFPWKNGKPGRQYDLVSGWLTNPDTKECWGRPVDTAVLPDGSLLISEDMYGVIYRLYKRPKAVIYVSINNSSTILH